MTKSTGIGRGRRTDLARTSKTKVEYVARAICKAKGFNPDNKMVDFEGSVFPTAMPPEYETSSPFHLRWEDFKTEAEAAIIACDNYSRKR